MDNFRDLSDTAVDTHWEELIRSMEDIGSHHEEMGDNVHTLHPGFVSIVEQDLSGRIDFDVLVPDNEFRRLEELADQMSAESYDIYRETRSGIVFLVILLKSATDESALLWPIYYESSNTTKVQEMIEEEGEIRCILRPLDKSREHIVTFEASELFLPE